MKRNEAIEIIRVHNPDVPSDKFMAVVLPCPDKILVVQAEYLLSRPLTDKREVS